MTTTTLHIYTDGSTGPTNPGLGGWAWAAWDTPGDTTADPVAGSCGSVDAETTSNRMELTAAVEALTDIYHYRQPPRRIVIYSDSRYLVDGVTGAIKVRAKNRDLWQMIWGGVDAFADHGTSIEWRWVRGHVGHPRNEWVDTQAKASRPLVSA